MKDFVPKELNARTRSNILVVAAGIGMYAVLLYFGHIAGFLKSLYGIISPFLIGIVVAFLLNSPLKRVEKLLTKWLSRKKPHKKLCRVLGVIVCYIGFLGLLAAFFAILVPQLVQSLRSIIVFAINFLSANTDKINQLLLRFDVLSQQGEDLVVMWENFRTQAMNLTSVALDYVMLVVNNIYTIIYQAFIGIIASVYLLLDKDKLGTQCKKLCYALLPRESCESLIKWTRTANRICSGFIVGKLIDSLIIGVICYIGMNIFRMEYPLLISVIVGVTNILPFFGPFIGAIPGILILLMVNPFSALWFLVWILVLQQFDGNILGPYILGDSVGISPLWIMVSIIIGGGLFGFLGMLLAVPAFALLYALVRTVIDARLRAKKLKTAAWAYAAAPDVPPDDLDADDAGEEKINE